jgi:hypothetical protein
MMASIAIMDDDDKWRMNLLSFLKCKFASKRSEAAGKS